MSRAQNNTLSGPCSSRRLAAHTCCPVQQLWPFLLLVFLVFAPMPTVAQQALTIEEVSSRSPYVNAFPVHLRLTWQTNIPTTSLDVKCCVTAVKGTMDSSRTELYLDLRTANNGVSFDAGQANWHFLPRIPYYLSDNTTQATAFQHCGLLDPSIELYFDSDNIRQLRNPEISVYQFTIPGSLITANNPTLVFDLRNAANPLEANADTAEFASITVSHSNLRSASGRRQNVYHWASMEVLKFQVQPNFYAQTSATLELTFRLRGLKQRKRLPGNSWISLNAPIGWRFSLQSQIVVYQPDLTSDSFPVLFTDCGRIGNVCTGGYLGAQLSATYEYNNRDWESQLRSLVFPNSPHVDAATYFDYSQNTSQVYVLGQAAGNEVVTYVNTTSWDSLPMADPTAWSAVPAQARYKRAVIQDVNTGDLQFSVDDTVLLRVRVTNVESPGNKASNAADELAMNTWTFHYGLIQSTALDKRLATVTVRARDVMLEAMEVSVKVKGFQSSATTPDAFTISSAPYASLVQLVFTVSKAIATSSRKNYFYLWTPAVSEQGNTWKFSSSNCKGDLGVLNCYNLDFASAGTNSLVHSLATSYFTVFGETVLDTTSGGSALQFSMFATSPKPGYSSNANWRLSLSEDGTTFAKILNHANGVSHASLTLVELQDFNAVNLNFISMHTSAVTPPPLSFAPKFSVSAIPAILTTSTIVEFQFQLRKLDLARTSARATSVEATMTGLRLTGPCEIKSYKNGFNLAKVETGIADSGHTLFIPMAHVKLSSNNDARIMVEVEVCASALAPANAVSLGQPDFGAAVGTGNAFLYTNAEVAGKWNLEVIGTGNAVLDLATVAHFSVATHAWDQRSSFSAISENRVVFQIYLPATTSLDPLTFTIRVNGLTLSACTLDRVPGSVSEFPTNTASVETLLCAESSSGYYFQLSQIPVTRSMLTFQVRATFPTPDGSSVEIWESVSRPNTTVTTTLRQHAPLRINSGPSSSRRFSQCGSQVSLSSSVVDPVGNVVVVQQTAAAPTSSSSNTSSSASASLVASTTTVAPITNTVAGTISEKDLLTTSPSIYPAQHALGQYFNQLHSGNSRVRIKTIPSLGNAYVLQDDQTQEFLMWSPLEPTDNVWLRGGYRLATVSASCNGLAAESSALYGDVDKDAADQADELWQTMILIVILALGLLFGFALLYNLAFHREDCFSRLRLILVLRYNWSGNLMSKNYYDYYGEEVGDDVALTYPSYWSIADERKLAKVQQKSNSAFRALANGPANEKPAKSKSSQDWPSKDDYYIPALPPGVDVYDLMDQDKQNSPGRNNGSLPTNIASNYAASKERNRSGSTVGEQHQRKNSLLSLEGIPPDLNNNGTDPSPLPSPSVGSDHYHSKLNWAPKRTMSTQQRSNTGDKLEQPPKRQSSTGSPLKQAPSCKFHICDQSVVEGVQRMLDETWKSTATRDRRRLAARIGGSARVPTRLEVGYVARVENTALWRQYAGLRSSMLQLSRGVDLKIPAHKPIPLSTKTWEAAGLPQPELFTPLNEFLFFHGTSPSAADSIANEGFKLSLAGKHGGSMYGAGIYASESCTKADEYSHDEWLEDDRYCAMLVLRAVAARVYYTADPHPDSKHIESLCKFNRFDSVLGDREKARDTFKEWIFFKPEQVYTEYIIRYKRRYDVRPPSYGAKLLHNVSYRALMPAGLGGSFSGLNASKYHKQIWAEHLAAEEDLKMKKKKDTTKITVDVEDAKGKYTADKKNKKADVVKRASSVGGVLDEETTARDREDRSGAKRSSFLNRPPGERDNGSSSSKDKNPTPSTTSTDGGTAAEQPGGVSKAKSISEQVRERELLQQKEKEKQENRDRKGKIATDSSSAAAAITAKLGGNNGADDDKRREKAAKENKRDSKTSRQKNSLTVENVKRQSVNLLRVETDTPDTNSNRSSVPSSILEGTHVATTRVPVPSPKHEKNSRLQTEFASSSSASDTEHTTKVKSPQRERKARLQDMSSGSDLEATRKTPSSYRAGRTK
ncbi:unnamed protein product [Amoebophrya sp. A120]|nr:unnamed protein product [Amoebophrya sp. A120]|eukprot:GSA120T00004873001.1